jgi:hypothetical protein
MRNAWGLLAVVFLSVAVAVAANLKGDTTVTDVAASPTTPLPAPVSQTAECAFGKQLFANVIRVHFSGPAMPTNSDGTFGGLTFSDRTAGTITIYEKYIVRDEFCGDGPGLRTVYVYDKLATFEQLLEP